MNSEGHPLGTGVYDEDEHRLINNQPAEAQRDNTSGGTRCLLFFVGLIALIAIILNHSLAPRQTPLQQKAELKQKIFDPIMEINKNALEEQEKQIQQQTPSQQEEKLATSNLVDEVKLPTIDPSIQSRSFQPQVPSQPAYQQPVLESKPKMNYIIGKRTAIQNLPVSQGNANLHQISQQAYDERFYAGEIHYSRIPVQYWQHRILMLKAMGLNTLSVYVMWNYHEISKGRFDYSTQNKNIAKFLELAIKHKMKVLLRPGPYICGEWDFGGLPARLLGIEGLIIRSADKKYLNEVQIYFASLAPVIRPYLLSNGGPIHMLQIQNELGSIGAHREYTKALVNMWEKLEVQCQFYIEDNSMSAPLNYFEGAAIGISDGSHAEDYARLSRNRKISNNTLLFGGEIYTGWMTHWGQRWGNNALYKFKYEMEYLFRNQKQFSLYMAHGGTNFGLTAGANAGMHGFSYEPMITSYDYNATITEQGRKTIKSDIIRSLMKMYVRDPEIPYPEPIPTIKFQGFSPKLAASLMENLGEPALTNETELYYFQHEKLAMYNQGIVVYETFLPKGRYYINMTVHDFVIIFLDSIIVDQHSRIRTDIFQSNLKCDQQKCKLQLLVQAMGHNNYGIDQQQDIKGLLSCNIFIEKSPEPNPSFEVLDVFWNFYKVNIDESILKMNKISTHYQKYPAILKGTFNLTVPGDTYINMEDYIKGYVWINGRNLGRYWSRGPQLRLYCPGVWLKKENNQIVILQLLTADKGTISGEHNLEDGVW